MKLKPYDVIVNGMLTTLKLSDAEATARGLIVVAEPLAEPVVTKAKTPSNKARKPVNKSAEAALGPKGATE